MAHDVFISYVTPDKEIADTVCQALEEQGLSCWIAPRDVPPGKSFASQIVAAIAASKVLVLIFSDDTNNSRHVPIEVHLATEHGKVIVPFRIGDAKPRNDLAYLLALVQWLNAGTSAQDMPLEELTNTIVQIVKNAPVRSTHKGKTADAKLKAEMNLRQLEEKCRQEDEDVLHGLPFPLSLDATKADEGPTVDELPTSIDLRESSKPKGASSASPAVSPVKISKGAESAAPIQLVPPTPRDSATSPPASPEKAEPEKPQAGEGPRRRLLEEGQIIRGTYEVERFLGEGAFGEVYRVKHRFLGRQAMKVFKVVGLSLDEAVKMLDEALTLSKMVHPHIVRVFEANTTPTVRGECCFFTMEYVAGGSLEQLWLSHGGLVPVPLAVNVVRQVCAGLAVAHAEDPPIIHRDVKPQNVLIGYETDGIRARVSDFGLARRVNPLTLLASARGTLQFKAPESLQMQQGDSCAGDVWAIGSTLYLLLTDRLPYMVPGQAPKRQFDRPLVQASLFNPRVDETLDRILTCALAVSAKDRYPSAREMLDALTNWRPDTAARPAPAAATATPPAPAKSAFGNSPPSQAQARAMAEAAVLTAKQTGRLPEAVKMLEEALASHPELREEYDYQLELWHRGIAM